jgi:PKD repeat protein
VIFITALIFSTTLLAYPVASLTPPVAYFTYTPENPILGDIMVFDASTSYDPDGNIVSYTWDFADGTPPQTVPGPVVTHNYTAVGTYNVTLTVADSEDLTDDFLDTIRILINPTANFTYSPTQPIVNQTVTFNTSASFDPDRSIVSYSWGLRRRVTSRHGSRPGNDPRLRGRNL